jgi:hypothetical protein
LKCGGLFYVKGTTEIEYFSNSFIFLEIAGWDSNNSSATFVVLGV